MGNGVIDNITTTLKEDLQAEITHGSKIAIASACFSLYAFNELKQELKDIEELRFLFSTPAFLDNKNDGKDVISSFSAGGFVFGSELEKKLRNNLMQKAVARECIEWIKEKAKFTSAKMPGGITNLINVDDTFYTGNLSFDGVGLGCEKDPNKLSCGIIKLDKTAGQVFLTMFDNFWNNRSMVENVTENVISNINIAAKDNSPEFLYYVILYRLFKEYLEEKEIEEKPALKNSVIWNKLYDFQKDAAVALINKLEKYNGCILADSVGLGKTFTALSVIKYYENERKSVLVLCPKKLGENWKTYNHRYENNILAKDDFHYKVLYHTDLSRKSGTSNDENLSQFKWSDFDLVVIDESHNFRNGGFNYEHEEQLEKYKKEFAVTKDLKRKNELQKKIGDLEKEIARIKENRKDNRYDNLMKKVIREGRKTKVLMLSATPVNNSFNDMLKQLDLIYEGYSSNFDKISGLDGTIRGIFIQAQKTYNDWCKLIPEDRTSQKLFERLDKNFFILLENLTIARSRRQIKQFYDVNAIGDFPKRLNPLDFRTHLSDKNNITFFELSEKILKLNLLVYTPVKFVLDSKKESYNIKTSGKGKDFKEKIQGMGLVKLMATGLFKRLESAVDSFSITLKRTLKTCEDTLAIIEKYEKDKKDVTLSDVKFNEDDFEEDNEIDIEVGKKEKVKLADIDYLSWKKCIVSDQKMLKEILAMLQEILDDNDAKLFKLRRFIDEKLAAPYNEGNKKILIFTSFADTAEYLYRDISEYVMKKHGLHTGIVTGSKARSNIKTLKDDFNSILTCFSPRSREMSVLLPEQKEVIDILIATDCISEGQNLQDCDCVVNYDIHWNPVRLIQRFGRIDRIGSTNKQIQMVNFWPDIDLEDYIKLEARVKNRMEMIILSTDPNESIFQPEPELTAEQNVEAEYRKRQIERMQKEIPDLEGLDGGFSFADAGLADLKMSLSSYFADHPQIKEMPQGLCAVLQSSDLEIEEEAREKAPAGAIFVLKYIGKNEQKARSNSLYPYYAIYMDKEGNSVIDHTQPQQLLQRLTELCRGKDKADEYVYDLVDVETGGYTDMDEYTTLLEKAIAIIQGNQQDDKATDIFSGSTTGFVGKDIQGMEDFELIAFFIVR